MDTGQIKRIKTLDESFLRPVKLNTDTVGILLSVHALMVFLSLDGETI